LFFTKASHLANSSLSPALLVAGAAGVLGVVSGGWLVARRPVTALVTTLILSGVALLALYPLAHNQAAAVALVAVRALAFGALGTIVQVRVLTVAPGSTDVASAASSSVFNVGIGGGAFVGGLVVASAGVQRTTLVAGAIEVIAIALYVGTHRRPTRAHHEAADTVPLAAAGASE